MEKITILMSTYNGEKYLIEQIESLLSQKNVTIDILVRDDGSSDKTIDILNKYQQECKLTWYTGANLGPAKSFMDLIYHAPDSDYYAFCDQDDVWLDDKLDIAINSLSNFDQSIPSLYYGNPRIVDASLLPLKQLSYSSDHMLTFSSSIINSNATGCTFVFNFKLFSYLKMEKPKFIIMHDAWVHKVCLALNGNIFYDNDVHILYRQHSNNVLGIDSSAFRKFQKKIKKIKVNKNSYLNMIISLYECYSELMSSNNKNICFLIMNYKNSFLTKLRIIFSKSFKTNYLIRDLYFRFLILFNLY